jgi:hypothetical protein
MDSLFKTLWSFLSPEIDSIQLASLARADVIDFDVLDPQTIQIRATWAAATHEDGWRLDISSQPNTRIEVGIFNEEGGEDRDEYSLGGLRAILGQNKDFEPTMFTFPHRHHILPSGNLETSLSPPYGSHPVLETVFPLSALQPPVNETLDHDTCTLHALYTLSNEVFVDKYQLSQLAQFKAGGIEKFQVWGETDLEDPSYKTPGWGSVVLVDTPKPDQKDTNMTQKLPLHLRYLEPIKGGGKRHLDILPPEVFWACQNTVEGTFFQFLANSDFTYSPFSPPSRSLLNTLFPSETVFYHLSNHITHNKYPLGSHGDRVVSLQVPVGDISQAGLVQGLTVLGILVGFTYLLVIGVRVGIKGLRWRGKGKEKAKDL